ncbi:MAG: hypothetical protein JST85_22350 [Acidobacteria bacterium]|nr:hypothetical protein [Acidobacteriota bacterium]
MLRYLFRKWTNLEFVASVATLLSFVLSAVPGFASTPQKPIRLVLLAFGAASAIWLVLLASRKAFVIVGYADVMSFLELLATHARLRIWTARTHTGLGIGEQTYFAILSERLASQERPLEDFRRLLRLAPQAHEHVDALIANFLYKNAAEVRYFTAGGPQFDFMIADDVAVIGFPMAGGTDNVAAVVLRHSGVVEAVANVFTQLWADPDTEVLFRGAVTFSEPSRAALVAHVENLFSQLAESSSNNRLRPTAHSTTVNRHN